MSWEGWVQLVCERGHSHACDGYEFEFVQEYWECPDCGAGLAWYNVVDVTNGSFDDDDNRIDGYVQLKIREAHRCECPTCGTEHSSSPTEYEIPKDEGHLVGEEE